ncbi:MAG TPA: lysophospholipid acyltransferase family protein [Spirochaetota bacterium]|nr:lysophospholipid acyltransferase family protein [Spirochaetota bacterium]
MVLLRLIILPILIIAYLTNILCIQLLPVSKWLKLRIIGYVCMVYCRLYKNLQGIKTITNGTTVTTPKGVLLISNHLSYIDIIIIAAEKPTLFITSLDLGSYFLPNLLARLSGTIYVDRSSFHTVKRDINTISRALAKKFRVALFPEATSGNGSRPRAFKASLLKAAIDSDCLIQPAALNYCRINRLPVSRQNRDLICWYGDMAFLPHLFKLMKLDSLQAKLTYCPAYTAHNMDRKTATQKAYDLIVKNYTPL